MSRVLVFIKTIASFGPSLSFFWQGIPCITSSLILSSTYRFTSGSRRNGFYPPFFLAFPRTLYFQVVLVLGMGINWKRGCWQWGAVGVTESEQCHIEDPSALHHQLLYDIFAIEQKVMNHDRSAHGSSANSVVTCLAASGWLKCWLRVGANILNMDGGLHHHFLATMFARYSCGQEVCNWAKLLLDDPRSTTRD